jgi:hypothetical protein
MAVIDALPVNPALTLGTVSLFHARVVQMEGAIGVNALAVRLGGVMS